MSIIETIQSRHITRTMLSSTCGLLSSEGSKGISSKEFNSYKDKLSAQQLGFLFEIYCAETYNLLPYKYDNTEDMGMNKQDVGCDLMDYDKRIYGQCKYYCNSNIRESTISGFIYFITSIKEPDNRFILFVNEDAKMFKPLIDSLEERGIELVRVSNEKFIEWLMSIHDTGSYWTELESDASSDQSVASEAISEDTLVVRDEAPNSDALIEKVTRDVKKRKATPISSKRGFISSERLKSTIDEWIKQHPDDKLPNGKYKEPPMRIMFGGFDFGRYYHEKCKNGNLGESIKTMVLSAFQPPPDVKTLTDAERYGILNDFWVTHQRLPTLDDTVELDIDDPLYGKTIGLNYKRIYEAASHRRSLIRDQVIDLFYGKKRRSNVDSDLTDKEVIDLLKRYKAEYNRLPKAADKFESYNVYRLLLKIRNGEVRRHIREEVLAIFEEWL